MNQYLAYRLFNWAGSTRAPRVSYAKVPVNGHSLRVYLHVEPVRKLLIEREFDNELSRCTKGRLRTSTRVGQAVLNKVRPEESGREEFQQLIEAWMVSMTCWSKR
ncbi:MAG: hypothetical protein M2R45_00591 [Verrucomicrobia subdivision 3 bacterium]|nr:hypothetical protein [Limisphaerales bacterium]MCS1417806.1 hypothetical protein [Limisphaerales bacterium]